jgi:surface antigen
MLACSRFLSACATTGENGPSKNEEAGAIVGTILGAVLGAAVAGRNNQAAGALIGALAGGLLGAGFGKYLDERERQHLAEASIRAAASGKTGERIAWGVPVADIKPVATTPTPPPKRHKRGSTAPSNWVTPASTQAFDPNAASGWVIPTNDPYVASNGQTCRDLHQVANKGGKTYEQNIRACQTAQGWVLPKA